jgi:hypothetical protein
VLSLADDGGTVVVTFMTPPSGPAMIGRGDGRGNG